MALRCFGKYPLYWAGIFFALVRLLIVSLLIVSLLNLPAAATEESAEKTRGRILGTSQAHYPDWFKDSFLAITEDVEEARDAGKHVILFFDLDDCPYCSKMIQESFTESPYRAFLQQNFDVIAINIRGDREVVFNEQVTLIEKELARHLQVRATPTILFLDPDSQPVLRLNGYRSATGFKHALDYVSEKAYLNTDLSSYIKGKQSGNPAYTLRQHPDFIRADDLSAFHDRPLMLIFEDASCDACDDLHDGLLSQQETRELLDRFVVVQLDAFSDKPLIGPDGRTTSPRVLARTLGIHYRPGIVLFDGGREIHRIDGMLKTFHFQLALRYVGERHYKRYPKYRDYSRQVQESILSSGRDIDVWK